MRMTALARCRPARRACASGTSTKLLIACSRVRAVVELESQLFEWADDVVQVSLARVDAEPGEADHAVATVRVSCDGAELLDLEGDPDGVEAWVREHQDELVAQYARRLRRDFPGERRVSWAHMLLN